MTDEEIMFERLFAPIKAKIQDKNRDITYLEKENAELKGKLAISEHDREHNDYELSEVYRDKTELTNSVTELKNKVTELEKQIEKMKCCENCKHSYTDSENLVFCYLPFPQENCKSCKLYNHKNTDNDYWELAE